MHQRQFVIFLPRIWRELAVGGEDADNCLGDPVRSEVLLVLVLVEEEEMDAQVPP